MKKLWAEWLAAVLAQVHTQFLSHLDRFRAGFRAKAGGQSGGRNIIAAGWQFVRRTADFLG